MHERIVFDQIVLTLAKIDRSIFVPPDYYVAVFLVYDTNYLENDLITIVVSKGVTEESDRKPIPGPIRLGDIDHVISR